MQAYMGVRQLGQKIKHYILVIQKGYVNTRPTMSKKRKSQIVTRGMRNFFRLFLFAAREKGRLTFL
jgi:hypothetical protein